MYKTFIKQIASLQIILGVVMLIPSVMSIIYQEWYSLTGFITAGIFTALSGYVIFKSLEQTDEPQYKHSLAIAAIGWLMIIVMGGLPIIKIAWITPIEEKAIICPCLIGL